MDAETRARNRAEVVSEVSKWTVGGGILVVALAPLALPILILTIAALVPLLVPLLAVALVAGAIALPVMLIRKLARSASRLWRPQSGQRPPERSARPATGH
jgi:uncharacterized membrane protein